LAKNSQRGIGALASYSSRVIANPTAAKVIAQIDIDGEFVRPLLNRLDYPPHWTCAGIPPHGQLRGHANEFDHSSTRDHTFFFIVNIGTSIYETDWISFANGPI